MNEDDKCMFTLTRNEVLENPDLLKIMYLMCGSKKIIDWLLKRTDEPSETVIPAEEINEDS